MNIAIGLIILLVLALSTAGQSSVASLEPAHAKAVQKFLQANPKLKFLSENSFNKYEVNYLKYFRENKLGRMPYYLAADFNRDRVRDFAVILAYDDPPRDQGVEMSPSHRYDHRLLIVVFNGLRSGRFKPSFKGEVRAPLVCFLSMTTGRRPRLYWGVTETDNTFYINPTRTGYIAEYPDTGH